EKEVDYATLLRTWRPQGHIYRAGDLVIVGRVEDAHRNHVSRRMDQSARHGVVAWRSVTVRGFFPDSANYHTVEVGRVIINNRCKIQNQIFVGPRRRQLNFFAEPNSTINLQSGRF